jgi:hypothetical protein
MAAHFVGPVQIPSLLKRRYGRAQSLHCLPVYDGQRHRATVRYRFQTARQLAVNAGTCRDAHAQASSGACGGKLGSFDGSQSGNAG